MRKYLVKTLMIKCPVCIDGRYYPDTGGFNSNCDLSEPCSFCKGWKFITITPKHRLFKEKYKEFVKKVIKELTIEYRQAQTVAGELGNKLSKYCKEFDKIINKGV